MDNSSVFYHEGANLSLLSTLLRLGWNATMVMIIITNLFQLLLISVVVRLRTRTNIILGSYCICLILSAILYLLPLMMGKVKFESSGLLCQLIKKIFYRLFPINIQYHICLLSIERLYAIGWPYKHKEIMSKSRLVVAIFCLWLFSAFVTILPATVWLHLKDDKSCQSTGNIDMFNLYSTYSQIITTILPILIAILACIGISIKANSIMNHHFDTTKNKTSYKANKLWKATKPILIMIIIYIVSSLPYIILQFLQQFKLIPQSFVINIATQISHIVAFFCYAIIPITMVFTNSDIMQVFTSLCCRTRHYIPDSIHEIAGQSELATT